MALHATLLGTSLSLWGAEIAPDKFLKRYCLDCHGERKQNGELRLDELSRDFSLLLTASRWADVIEKINASEMPPVDFKEQPSPQERSRFVESLSVLLKEGESARLARREPVSLRKLTREEYAWTLHDLLGVQHVVEDPGGLTEDADFNGFERLGSVLTLSPAHVEKYVAIARKVLDEAFPETRPIPFKETRLGYKMTGNPSDWESLEREGRAHLARAEVWPNWLLRRVGPPRIAVDGLYRIRLKVSGLPVADGEAPHLLLYAENLDRVLFEKDIIAPEDQPEIIEFTTHLSEGNHTILLYNTASGPPFNNYSSRDGGTYSPFFSTRDTGRPPWQNKLLDEEGKPIWPFLILDWIEWEGPLLTEGPSDVEANYLPADFDDLKQVRSAFHRFATRAFRRPPSEEEIDRLVKIYVDERAAAERLASEQAAPKLVANRNTSLMNERHHALSALKTALASVLCSKDFLYLVEGLPYADENASHAEVSLSAWELASRLSYFLWSTMPDEALFECARDGSLLQQDVLREQFRRMVADRRAERFSEDFPRSWLQLRKLGMFPPDKTLYPDYSKHLQTSMERETILFFREVLEKDLTLREFLQSDWTMLNARLARHYQITGVEGDEFRRVSLLPGHHRGGLLTQAAILSLTSDGTRHRPVHRGKWIIESVFGRPVPPPPGSVDPIEPTPPEQPKATLRQKLDAHKKDARCAECHRKIDPLGLAFDHFDAIGRWRTEEIMSDGSGSNPLVDASGELADGRKFDDQEDLKRLLLDNIDNFNAAIVEKLAMFALRRTMTYDDREELQKIAAKGKASDYQLKALIEAVVLSDLFRNR